MTHTPHTHVGRHATGQSVFDPAPASAEEARRRQHTAALVLDMIDPGVSGDVRDQALAHVLVCDPEMGLGMLAVLTRNTLAALDELAGQPAGTGVAELRRQQTTIAAGSWPFPDDTGNGGSRG